MYALNTRNEDHEAFVAGLRQSYEERMRQVETRLAGRLGEMGKRVRSACEEGERKFVEAREKAEEEKNQLKQAHVSVLCIF